MSLQANVHFLSVILALIFFVPLEGITVKPARCPTNKIAPHKRSAYYGHGARTYGGAFYDLLSPGPGGTQQQQPQQQQDQLTTLHEQPQEDEPDDCGDIEDYDETDLSSLSHQQPYMQQGHDNRFFFGAWQRPTATPPPPTRPPVTHMPTPHYWSGGYFGGNHYRPPLLQDPSEHVKPVHEGAHESHSTYRPDIVGGPLGHVVGHSPVQLTTKPPSYYTTQKREHQHTRYPPRPTQPTLHTTRPSRPRMYNNDGILGSFVDLLLFK